MKNVLVTGVSQGLGLEIARCLLRRGFSVYGASRSTNDAIKGLLDKYQDRFSYYPVDLGLVANAGKLFREFIPYKVQLHGFVNNAALAYDDIISNLKEHELEKMFKLNVFSPFMLTKYALRNMLLHQLEGSIVHISSISAHTGYKGLAMYAATKGALEAFSKNTAREWGPKGIRSNCVVTGFMETGMTATLTAEQTARIYARTALKIPTNKTSVAETVAFLLSDAATSISGQNIFVDSGTI